MKYIKIISWILGISMFLSGFLKFFHPFKGWYSVQISASQLGEVAYASGIMGELTVGLIFIIASLGKERLTHRLYVSMITGASLLMIIIMATAVYVHLHPAVPAEVLPMKIKAPFIPGLFLLSGLLNVALALRLSQIPFYPDQAHASSNY